MVNVMADMIELDSEGEITRIARVIDLDYLLGRSANDEGLIEKLEEELDEDDCLTTIELTVPQTKFLLLDCKFPLFVAGFGSGKSLCMTASIIFDLELHPTVRIGCYAPTYDLLRLITAPYIEVALENAGIAFNYNKTEHIFYIHTGQKIILRSMDKPSSIVGYETFRSHIDEIDTLEADKAEESWNKIIARNRQKIFDLDENGDKKFYLEDQYNDKNELIEGKEKGKPIYLLNKVSAYSTPEGFRFCYKRWVKEKKENDGYEFIQAATHSNPHLPIDYVDVLRSTYPAGLVDAYIEGKFVNLTAGSVYPEFSRELNHTNATIKFGEDIHCGMDFNVGRMCVSIFVIRDNTPYMVDEIYKSRDTETVCQILEERYGAEHSITIYPDASGNNKSSKGASQSDFTIIKRFGFRIKAKNKNPFIKDRVHSVNAIICNSKQERNFFVNTQACPNATDCLEQQPYKDGVPCKASGYDDMNDCIGYLVHYLWPMRKIIKKRGYAVTHHRAA